jgi:polyisoprenoid-binding protein YceI
MKTSRATHFIFCPLIIALITGSSFKAFSQDKYRASTLNVTVAGTSTLHDWEMVSNKGQVEAFITVDKDNLAFSGLSFVFPAESLKSGHDLMDKNTYKALNTEKNPTISFVLSSANVTPAGGNTYNFKGVGKLTIAGTTVLTDLVATVKYNPVDKSFTCVGTKKFKMTQYNVKPPTVMMGAIKTGDDISISYNLTIKG